jgi:signal peptidase I
MSDDGELDDDPASSEGEAAAEQEPRPDPFYDPLTDPWNDAASASIIEYRLSRAREETPYLRPRPFAERPYAAGDELSDLRRRLREGTVVVPKRARVWSVTLRELAETLLLAVLIFLAVRASMQNFRVEGASMEPSLDNGEFLIVNKLAYTQIDLSIFDWLPFFDAGDDPVHHLWSAPSRGDVIVFRAPTSVNRDFIKRIVGIPGDVLQIDPATNAVLVNGESIDEPYIDGRTTCQSSCGPWTVPEGAYFVMGDNRQNSSDSRQGWFVPEENIIGKALITYWQDGGPELELAPNHKVSLTSEASAEE